MTIIFILMCLFAVGVAAWLYVRAQRRKPRKRAASRYFAVDLTDTDPPETPTIPRP